MEAKQHFLHLDTTFPVVVTCPYTSVTFVWPFQLKSDFHTNQDSELDRKKFHITLPSVLSESNLN